ncbi:Unknown protein, partial [Striga hermonthica]
MAFTTPGNSSFANQNGAASQLVFPQSQLITLKLEDSNFLIWKQQILTAIRGYGLESFISATTSPPDRFITPEEGNLPMLNPEYDIWQRQDQLLASWILSSLSQGNLILVVGLSSSKEIWNALEKNFASQSRARIMQHKLELQTMKKGNMTMREYLNKMKTCFDLLAAV